MESYKTCRKCGERKPLDAFYRAAGTRDGHRGECITCAQAARRSWYEQNREISIERARQWQHDNPERHRETQRRIRRSPEGKLRNRAGHLRRKYGITLEEYDQLLAKQGGVCAICKAPPNDVISLHVDHEHGTGRIRGCLCVKCNNALGLFDEDPALFAAAVTYLTAGVASPDL